MSGKEYKFLAVFILFFLVTFSFLIITDFYELQKVDRLKTERLENVKQSLEVLLKTELNIEYKNNEVKRLLSEKKSVISNFTELKEDKQYVIIAQFTVLLLSFIGLSLLQSKIFS